jgi:hypothetical protein
VQAHPVAAAILGFIGSGKKGADAKTPAKPFPFGDKAKTEEKKPEATPIAK